ncbi:MAG: hypothetical protein QW561_05050 [Candidatus Aenigmatarchaeota archaeon]
MKEKKCVRGKRKAVEEIINKYPVIERKRIRDIISSLPPHAKEREEDIRIASEISLFYEDRIKAFEVMCNYLFRRKNPRDAREIYEDEKKLYEKRIKNRIKRDVDLLKISLEAYHDMGNGEFEMMIGDEEFEEDSHIRKRDRIFDDEEIDS